MSNGSNWDRKPQNIEVHLYSHGLIYMVNPALVYSLNSVLYYELGIPGID